MAAPDGTPVKIVYRIVEAKPGTWLSKVTYDFGWGDKYSKKQGYGAYDRSVIFPLGNLPPQQPIYHADKILPGQQFAVQIAQVAVLSFEAGSKVEGQTRATLSRNWAWRSVESGGGAIGVELEAATIEIMNRKTGLTARYSYTGAGYGGGVSFPYEGESGWVDFTTKQYLALEDFEGDAIHGSAGVGASAEEYTLANRGAEGETMSLKGTGVSLKAGAGQTYGAFLLVEYSQKEPR